MATSDSELPATPLPGAPASESDAMAQTMALIQPWIDYVPQQQRRLGLFIFLALLVHLATFFFIRIDTTRAELQHQTRIRVTVENPQTITQEAQSSDDFWNRLTDPRLFILPITPMAYFPSDQPALDFTSINSSLGPQQLPVPAQAGNYQFIHEEVVPLEQRVTATMIPTHQPFVYDETPPTIATHTTWQWDTSLAQRKPTGVPDLPSPVLDTDLTPTELRIAVDSGGTVQHVLVDQGCGKLELDQQAVLAARKIRLQPSDHPGLLWGRITIFWHYAAKPREEVVPTPLSSP